MLAQRQRSTTSFYQLGDVHSEKTETRTPVQVVTADLTGIPGIILGVVYASATGTAISDFFLPRLSLSYILTADEPDLTYDILRPIPIVIEQNDDYFVASFIEANLHASGESVHDAFDNLKSYIGDVFEEFLRIGRERLGPGPSRELAVLEQYIREHH